MLLLVQMDIFLQLAHIIVDKHIVVDASNIFHAYIFIYFFSTIIELNVLTTLCMDFPLRLRNGHRPRPCHATDAIKYAVTPASDLQFSKVIYSHSYACDQKHILFTHNSAQCIYDKYIGGMTKSIVHTHALTVSHALTQNTKMRKP